MASAVAIAIRETEAREAQAQAMQAIAETMQRLLAQQTEILLAIAALEAALTAPATVAPAKAAKS